MQKLFDKGEVSAQDRDHAEATVKMSQANVDALEESAKAEAAALNVAQANRKQVDVRQSEISTTLAQLEQARATEAQVATQLGYTKIYAPIDGIVSVRVAKQGEVVSQGSPIVVVVDMDHLWVRADVEESYIDSIQFGQTMRVQLAFGRHPRRAGVFQGRGKRLRHAARREPHQARHQDFRHQSVAAESGPALVHRNDGDRAAASAPQEPKKLVRAALRRASGTPA